MRASVDRSLEVSVIGAGLVAPRHIEAQARLGSRVTIYDIDLAKAQKLVTRLEEHYPGQIRLAKHPDEAFQAAQLIEVLTPDHLHYRYAARSLRAGIPVFVEKPLTTDLHEAHNLADLAREHNVKTFVGHYALRLHQNYSAAMEVITGGDLGQIHHMRGSYIHNMDGLNIKTPWRTGQNPIYGMAVHPLDAIWWLTGEQLPESVRVEVGDKSDPTSQYPEVYLIKMLHSFGTSEVRVNTRVPDTIHDVGLEIIGQNGTLKTSNKWDGYLIARDGAQEFSYVHVPKPSEWQSDRLARIMNDRILGHTLDRSRIPTISEVIPLMEVMDQIDRMAHPKAT